MPSMPPFLTAFEKIRIWEGATGTLLSPTARDLLESFFDLHSAEAEARATDEVGQDILKSLKGEVL